MGYLEYIAQNGQDEMKRVLQGIYDSAQDDIDDSQRNTPLREFYLGEKHFKKSDGSYFEDDAEDLIERLHRHIEQYQIDFDVDVTLEEAVKGL